jgi:hypothetical protein
MSTATDRNRYFVVTDTTTMPTILGAATAVRRAQ